jgi:hypothetical protein
MAFCVWPSTRVPGFVSVNWTGQLRDLVMLTHELGHGTNWGLAARAQTDNSLKPGIAVAEVPSTFAELLLVEHLLSTDEDLGRALLARELDQAVMVAYMSAAFARFEQAAYALRAELSQDRLARSASCGGEGLGRRGDRRARRRQPGGRRSRCSSSRASTTTRTPPRSCSPPGWSPARASQASPSATSVSSRLAARRRPRSC